MKRGRLAADLGSRPIFLTKKKEEEEDNENAMNKFVPKFWKLNKTDTNSTKNRISE